MQLKKKKHSRWIIFQQKNQTINPFSCFVEVDCLFHRKNYSHRHYTLPLQLHINYRMWWRSWYYIHPSTILIINTYTIVFMLLDGERRFHSHFLHRKSSTEMEWKCKGTRASFLIIKIIIMKWTISSWDFVFSFDSSTIWFRIWILLHVLYISGKRDWVLEFFIRWCSSFKETWNLFSPLLLLESNHIAIGFEIRIQCDWKRMKDFLIGILFMFR